MRNLLVALILILACALPVNALTMTDLKNAAVNAGQGACSGAISEQGMLVWIAVDTPTEHTVYIFDENVERFVAAVWPASNQDGQPTSLKIGTVDNKGVLTVKSVRPFDPVKDADGPCPVLFPRKA